MTIGMFGLLATTACGDDGLGPEAITAAQSKPLCEADCKHDIACGASDDLAGCTTKCIAELTILKFRGDAAEALFACTLPLACDAKDDACELEIEPLAIHEQWETKCRASLATCSDLAPLCEVTPTGKDDDVAVLRFTAPEAMTQLIKCLDATTCGARIECITEVLPVNL